MNKKNNIKTVLILILKTFVYSTTMFFFVFAFSFRYLGLTFLSRTLLITCGTFLISAFLMSNIYGSLDIGARKSKQILQSMALNLFITNLIAFIALKVMGYHDQVSIVGDLVILVMVLILQLGVVRAVIFLGNDIYFRITPPERVVIIHDDSTYLNKVTFFLKRHAKQFTITEILSPQEIESTNFQNFDRVILLNVDQNSFSSCIDKCYLLDINIMYNAGLYDVLKKPRASMVLDDILMYEISGLKITFVQSIFKRLIDLIIAALALIVLSPLMLIVGLLVKINDGGSVFYSQDRLTKDGRKFLVYKFRSMKVDSGDAPASLDDDRITKVGKVIRKIRIDELPQLINILKGDMSIVGPRPESVYMTHNINKRVPQFEFRLKVKGGLTGYAQIFGKYNTHPMDKLLLDLEYIENFSIMNDIKLIFQTLIVFVKKDSTEGFNSSEINENENTLY